MANSVNGSLKEGPCVHCTVNDVVIHDTFLMQTYQSWLGSTSEQTPSESVATSEVVSEGEVPGHHRLQSTKQTYDYSEQAESATSVSTPHQNEDDPFASDNLGDTVIHFGSVSGWRGD